MTLLNTDKALNMTLTITSLPGEGFGTSLNFFQLFVDFPTLPGQLDQLRILPWGASDSNATECHVWDLWVGGSLSSSKAMFLLIYRVGQSTFWNETPGFILSDFCHPTAQIWTRLTIQIREKCSGRSSKFMISMNWSSAWLMSDMLLSKASFTTQLISITHISAQEFTWKEDLLSIWFNSSNAYVDLHILFVNFMNIKQVLLC